MKEYLMLFRNASAADAYLSTAKEMAEDLPKWQSWIGNIAMQGNLVHTAPIEYNGIVIHGNGMIDGPYKEADNILASGFLICRSESFQQVQEWSATCPILRYPGSSVEVRPLIPFSTN